MDSLPIPLFNWGALPEEEHGRARHVQNQLLVMHFTVQFFQSAVELVEHARQLHRDDWRAMAADSAILTLYNFQSTLNSILDGIGRCPTLKRRVSTKRLHNVLQVFYSAFPDWLDLRDGVCHYSDKMFAPPNMGELRPDSGRFIHGWMGDISMHYVIDGRTVKQPVTIFELAKLDGLKRDVFETFQKVCQPPPEGQTSRPR